MNKERCSEQIKEMIREIHPETNLDNAKMLTDGVLDSVELLELVNAIEESFNVEIQPEYLNSEYFDTTDDIARLIEKTKDETEN